MRRLSCYLLVLAALAGCDEEDPPRDDYYARKIQPILDAACSGNTSGCHRVDPADPFAQAAGNLDTTSFDNVHKRPDLLRTFGAYPAPLLLIKAIGRTDDLAVSYNGRFLPLEIEHVGGNLLAIDSPAFVELQRWLSRGATRTGIAPPEAPVSGAGNCSTALPADFDPAVVTSSPAYQMAAGDFDGVQAVIEEKGCSAQNCHGAPQSDFYITCGSDEAQKAFNFNQVHAFVSATPADSEFLRRPLAPGLGGVAHTGGVHFGSLTDEGYETFLAFAEKVGVLEFGEGDTGKQFFAENVMPVFLQRGCASEGCHSAGAMNDFKLRAGSTGHFSAIALEKNYDLAKREFLAFEVPDVRRGRLVAKTIRATFGGIAHRGGPVLAGEDPAKCGTAAETDSMRAFCVLVEWSAIERANALAEPASIDRLGAGDTVPLVYVERQASHVKSPLEFADLQAGSDLLVVDAALDGEGSITGVSGRRSLLDGCPGAENRAAIDVRGPDVAFDGRRVAFAMRTSQSDFLHVYTVNIDGSSCTKLTSGNAHHFDPAWAPDGSAIVFASSEAGGTSKMGRPQADLWRMGPTGQDPERITFLSQSEISPQFMREGRLIMTTEKADPSGDFYQLSGRRLNWDLTDYHPLVGQRARSPFGDFPDGDAERPSIDYAQVTEIREGFDGNFLIVLSDVGARGGAGTLGVFNRSIGPFEAGREVGGQYVPALAVLDPAASGRVGASSTGAYRSPFPLLDGRVMASYASGSFDLGSVASLDFDLVAVDARGNRQVILADAGSQVEAVLAVRYPPRAPYLNRRQLVFGGFGSSGDKAEVHFPDAPMLATLLTANLRRGRPVDQFRDADRVAIVSPGGQVLAEANLRGDGSAKLCVPAGAPALIQLRRGGTPVFTMTEEHQFAPGEHISLGVSEKLFDHVCAGCHGSISGRELDISVTPDALTGASQSQSASDDPCQDGP